MKKAYLKELQSQLLGTVTDNDDAREYFSTDGSIFKIMPEGVVYPHNTADVRKTVKYLDERARSGRKIGLIARGKGTDQSGGAVGDGLQLVFPAHMNRILGLEKTTVTVQPGILYRTLEQTLHTHNRFLPPYPASLDYSTIGGAVANNAGGEKSFKYGTTRDFVKNLKVVLADGSLIEAHRISAKELNRKKGQTDLEGDIYRGLDSLILDNAELIAARQPQASKNAAGYALGNVRGKDGSFDLAQVIIGSQGTLGVVTEVTLRTMPWYQRTTLVVGFFDDIKKAGEAVLKLRALEPSAIELVDYYLLQNLRQNRPQEIEGLVPDELPMLTLLVEFDDGSQLTQMRHSRRAQHILGKLASSFRVSTDPIEQEALWKIRRGAAAAMSLQHGAKKAVPFIEDAAVDVTKLPDFLMKTYDLLRKYELEIAVWGHAGDGNLHLQPFLDLSKKKDVAKLYDLADDFYALVRKLGGTMSGEHNDGLIRAPYLKQQYGEPMYELFRQTKHIFDPQNILNPDKKIDVTQAYARQFIRQEYSMGHLYDHLPHT